MFIRDRTYKPAKSNATETKSSAHPYSGQT